MTEELFDIMVLGVLAVIFATVLKKYCGELSILLTIFASLILGLFFLRLFRPLLSFVEELRELTDLDPELLNPVLKCLGIGLLSQICVSICSDAGQNTIGKTIQMCSCVLCLYIALPLFRGILSLISGLGA